MNNDVTSVSFAVNTPVEFLLGKLEKKKIKIIK